MKRTISMSAAVHADTPDPEYQIGDRLHDAYADSEGTVIGVIYVKEQECKPRWEYMIRFDVDDVRQARECDLSHPDEYPEYDRCEA